MSGHSKWSTIKHQKAATDAAKGKLFSKLAKAISLAAKSGSPDPEANFKLRIAIEAARAANMPKANVERALSKSEGGAIEEVVYEGFGPGGVAVMVETATDNRNRTGQEIKNLFERLGGGLAGPGAVSFNFDPKGYLSIKKESNKDEQMLKLIDLGVEDVDEGEEGTIDAYVNPRQLSEIRKRIEEAGLEVIAVDHVKLPKTYVKIEDPRQMEKIVDFLQKIEGLEDVQKVFANVDFPPEMTKTAQNE